MAVTKTGKFEPITNPSLGSKGQIRVKSNFLVQNCSYFKFSDTVKYYILQLRSEGIQNFCNEIMRYNQERATKLQL